MNILKQETVNGIELTILEDKSKKVFLVTQKTIVGTTKKTFKNLEDAEFQFLSLKRFASIPACVEVRQPH